MKTCDTCAWAIPDHPVNRGFYGADVEWPICNRRYSGKTGEHVEPTDGCDRHAGRDHARRSGGEDDSSD